MKNILKRFVEYVQIDTESVEGAETVPSTKGQFDLANKLAEELKGLGVENVKVDEHACVTGVLKSNLEAGKKAPAIGFLAHLDTAPDCSGKNVKPQIHENYSGGNIVINEELNVVLTPEANPDLKKYIGHTIVTSDGTTLLGADNKAGISIIMDAVETLVNNPDIKHGDMCIGFTPDEEVQGGAELFDIDGFGAEFAFTVDGDGVGEFNHETFNGASGTVTVRGVCIHPGAAKDKLINPLMIASEYLQMLPKNELPETTEGREGYYYCCEINGNETSLTMDFILRDFDKENLEVRKNMMNEIADRLNAKWGGDYVSVEMEDNYPNMNYYFEGCQHIIENTLEAYRQCGMEPNIVAVRGGTDGSTLSRRGLPTPNIFVGGANYHSVSEFCSVEGMEKARDVVIKILEIYSGK